MKIKLARFIQTHVVNHTVRTHAGSPGSRYALLETVGHKTHTQRQTPVGYCLDGNTIWVISIFGPDAYYVGNLKADPHVRIKVDGTWRSGIAHAVPEDDPIERLKQFNPDSATEIKRYGPQAMSIRIDLDPVPARA